MLSFGTSRQQRELLAASLLTKVNAQQGREMALLPWVALHRAELKPGVRFDLLRHRYLLDIYKEQAEEAVIYKAGQMGASEYAISYALYMADVMRATVLYVFPTDTHVSDFSAARLGPAIECSPYLDGIVVEGRAAQAEGQQRRQRGADRVTLKRVRDRFVYMRGAQVKPDGQAPQLKSIDADVLILDEVDEMDPRAPAIAEKRLGHSEIKARRWISTPTFEGWGIHAKWLESDMREWHVRCSHCGEWQPLNIDQVVTEWDELGRPTAWHGEDEERAWAACRKCSAELNRLGPGQWVAEFPSRRLAGYHLTKLFSAQTPLLAVVEALQTVDETKRREAYNQDLGLPYTPRGGQLTPTTLDNCRRGYAHGPVAGEETVLGCDVGKVLHVVIRGPRDVETGERPQRWAGAIDSFEALARLMKQYNVITAVIDALPETRKARELQAAFPRKTVWLAYYTTQKSGSKEEEPAVFDLRKGVVNLDRTRMLDATFAQFYECAATLPGHARDIRDYYAHMCASVRIVEDGVAKYVEGHAGDHLAHAENYCLAAARRPVVRKRARSYQG
jgi:hypothetical protein